MQLWREECLRLEASSPGIYAPGSRSWWFGNMLERSPALMWPAVSNPLLLDFAERVVGPFVQLDNLTLAAFPSVSKEEAAGKVTGWHRDRWAHMPSGHYERPTAWNTICYLQDLTDEYGSLRVIPGSHINPVAMDEHEQTRPTRTRSWSTPRRGMWCSPTTACCIRERLMPRASGATSSLSTTTPAGSSRPTPWAAQLPAAHPLGPQAQRPPLVTSAGGG